MFDLDAILKATGTMIIATDPVGTIEIFSSAAEQMLGWKASEVVDQQIWMLWHDPTEVAARAVELSRELGKKVSPGFEVFVVKAREQGNEQRQWSFIRKNNSRFPVSLTMSAIRDGLGTITGYVGTAVDLTGLNQAAEQRDSFFELSLDLLGIANSGYYFKRINPSFSRVLGWTEQEFLSRPFLDFVHPADQSATRGIIEQIAAGQPTLHFENRYRCKDGSWKWIAWTCASQSDGSLYASGRDVTALKLAEEALRQTQQDLAITLNSIGDAVLATNAERRITRMNPVAEQLTGWKLSEAMGQAIEQVFHVIHEGTRLPAVIPVDEVLATGTIHGLSSHTVLISRDGTERPIAENAAPIQDDAGRTIGVVLVFRDTSKARSLERKLQESNSNLEKQIAARTADLLTEQRRLRYGNLVLESIASESPLYETMQLITKFVADEGAVTRFGIVLLDDKNERLQLVINRDLSEDIVETLRQLPSDESANSLWQAVLFGQRAIVKHPSDPGLVPNGAWRFCWVEPIVSSNGEVLGAFVISKVDSGPLSEDELTLVECACRLARFAIQRVQNRTSLEASEQRHRALLEHFPAPVFVYDRESLAYLAVSDRAVDEYGYSREEFMQMSLRDIRPEEDLQALQKMLSASGVEFEHRGLWRHRKKKWQPD